MTIQVLTGDCRDVLRTLADGSVHCIVTSPPYWGLRDYGVAGQIGLEQSPDEYVAEMVGVFREVRRVLRDDGTLWLNLGDCYATGAAKVGEHPGGGEQGGKWAGASPVRGERTRALRDGRHAGKHTAITAMGPMTQPNRMPIAGLKPKDLVGMPWRVAFALQADGWWLRQDNIWAKRNCMPESIRDRTTRAHEYVFQLTKSGSSTFWTHRDRAGQRTAPEPDYRWVRKETGAEQSFAPNGWPEAGKDIWRRINLWTGHDYFYDAVAIEEEGDIPAGTRAAKGSAERASQEGVNARPPEYKVYSGKRNKRSVWHVATQPFAEAHFATMPAAIVETCVLAGSSERGCCAACGAPWTRQVTHSVVPGPKAAKTFVVDARDLQADDNDQGSNRQKDGHKPGYQALNITTGWLPSCACAAGEPVPCTVLDPFGGAGTTGLVADRLGRNAILIELNPEYAEMTKRRLVNDAGMFASFT